MLGQSSYQLPRYGAERKQEFTRARRVLAIEPKPTYRASAQQLGESRVIQQHAQASATVSERLKQVSGEVLASQRWVALVARTSEIRIRITLGTRPSEVQRMVLREAIVLIAVGACVGLPLAFASVRLTGGRLFGASPSDPQILAGDVLLIGLGGRGYRRGGHHGSIRWWPLTMVDLALCGRLERSPAMRASGAELSPALTAFCRHHGIGYQLPGPA
jgi:hypothetical protein